MEHAPPELEMEWTVEFSLPEYARLHVHGRRQRGKLCDCLLGFIPGILGKDVYGIDSYAASCCRSCLNIPYGSYICPLSNGVWQLHIPPGAAER